MSLREFQKEKCPNILQSIFRRELGLVGLWGQGGKVATTAIDVIINRQLIERRAKNNTRRVDQTKVSNGRKKKYCEEQNKDDPLKSKLLVKTWIKPEDSHVLLIIDKVFIRAKKTGCGSYVAYIIGPGLGLKPTLQSKYKISSKYGWSSYEAWEPSTPQSSPIEQYAIVFALEKPGHVLRSFYFDSGKNYKTILLDSNAKFRSIAVDEKTLTINPVKTSLTEEGKDSPSDFIVLTCPELKLVTRCRVTKAAIGNSSIQVRGEFIMLTSCRRVEVCDLMKTIESSPNLLEEDFEVEDGSSIEIPVTHILMEKPQILYVVHDTLMSHVEFGYPSWPPHFVKKTKLDKFQVMSAQAEFNRNLEGVNLLNLTDPTITHDEDNLTFHPDTSNRLILAGQYEISVILMTFDAETAKTTFEIQFSKNLAEQNSPSPVESSPGSRRAGLRNVPRPNYFAGLPDDERGILRWTYFEYLDIFVILEYSNSNFKLHLYDNQSWEVLTMIDLSNSKGLSPVVRPGMRYIDLDFSPNRFIVDVTNEVIVIRRLGTAKHVSNLCVVNLLSDSVHDNPNDLHG